MTVFLYILNGKNEGQCIELSTGNYIIGRKKDADIVIKDDKYVSEIHAEMKVTENKILTIADKGSKNGTYLLGDIVTNHIEVKPGDIFRIGHTF